MSLPLVIGLGDTGVSCARYFSARGEAFALADDNPAPRGLPAIRAFAPKALFGPVSTPSCLAASALVVSPGVPLDRPEIRAAVEAGIPVTGDVAIFAEVAQAPLVAITGSNGKSTVTTLLGCMAERAGKNVGVGGNLGTPCLDLLDAARDLYVLEVSSFQLDTAPRLGADVAVLLNLSPDHLDRYPDYAAYCASKRSVFNGCRVAVVNRAPRADASPAPIGCEVWTFGLDGPSTTRDFGLVVDDSGSWLACGGKKLVDSRALKLAGRHNLLNVLAALAAGAAAGLAYDVMVEAACCFKGLPHRTQWVAEQAGVTFYNDSKATNPGATIAALEGLAGAGGIVLMLGGQDKGVSFTELARRVRQLVKHVVVFGQDAERIASVMSGVATSRARTMTAALATARGLAAPGDIVLLSPACASFDEFEGYAHRGDVFRSHVLEGGANG